MLQECFRQLKTDRDEEQEEELSWMIKSLHELYQLPRKRLRQILSVARKGCARALV